jgi:putative salt-induced outer membrane protein YdiY
MVWEVYDRDITSRLFGFERLDLEYDEFEDLSFRSTLSGGLGYFLLRSDRKELKVRGALAYEHEEFHGDNSDDSFLISAGWDSHFDICKWFRYTSRFTFFLDPLEFDAWRLDSENAGEIPLSQKSGWKFKFGLHTEYDNDPQPGIDTRDLSYFVSFAYDWD